MDIHPSDLLWNESFTVRSFEMDHEGRASFQSIANYLMEGAANHANALQVSVMQLMDKNLTWVLSRLHIRIDDYPRWQQQVNIQTWPSDKNDLFAIRDFRITDGRQQLIGKGTSSWMLLNLKTRKPVPMPEFMNRLINHEAGRALTDTFEKLPRLERIEFEKKFHVRLSDLDINQHVNFIHYIEWAIETVPPEIRQQNQLADLQISFRAESRYGDLIQAQSCILESDSRRVFLHRLIEEKSQNELTRLVSGWIPKK